MITKQKNILGASWFIFNDIMEDLDWWRSCWLDHLLRVLVEDCFPSDFIKRPILKTIALDFGLTEPSVSRNGEIGIELFLTCEFSFQDFKGLDDAIKVWFEDSTKVLKEAEELLGCIGEIRELLGYE